LYGGSGGDVLFGDSDPDAPPFTKGTYGNDSCMAGQTFIDAQQFGQMAGEVRYDAATGLVSGDLDGDGHADYSIELRGSVDLTGVDLIL
ncbi:MAG: hypothetical protein ABI832_08365, partial [bacterium]